MLISKEASITLADRIQQSKEVYCSGLFLSARWFVLSQVAQKGLHFVIMPDKDSAEYCCTDLYGLCEGDNVFFLPQSGKEVERSNYKSTLGVQRTSAISRIMSSEKFELSIVVSYPEAIEELIPADKSYKSCIFRVKKGEEISHENIKEKLFSMNFEKVDFVAGPGQFAIRGSIVDIFSYSDNQPYRLAFWGDEVERIQLFDCNTQLSIKDVEELEIISDISSEVEENKGRCILDVLPKSSVVWLDSSDIYREKKFFASVFLYKRVYLNRPLSAEDEEFVQFHINPQPIFNKNFELLAHDIRKKREMGYRVRVYGEKRSQLERISAILSQNESYIPEYVSGVTVHNGFIDEDEKICIYSDHEIFDRFHRASIRRSVEKTEQLTLNDLNSFNIGDYVVHIDHGIGIFGGLVRKMDDKGRISEVVKITYKDGDVIFVSVHSLHKIARYRSKDGIPPKINKLGSKTWSVMKNNAKAKVKDIAKDLIQLYAKRKSSQGYAYSPDTYLQDELESSFMYEDTPDQEAATKAIKKDMEDNCPMDRLVCGDVGFGKTELAVRAAFKAVCDSKQVAVLVPTTILALQHYNTFKQRLENLPCNIEHVSRLRTTKEVSDIKSRLKEGQIDILIGTHKILGAGFDFKDLGLLIIDEEQKFGVSAKEKLRQVKASVDTLTLTATPIPRTLQFSLLGARDLSIINTPPPNRIPVQTEIMLFNEKEIKSIVNYELNRGGQVFFVHNKVEQIYSIYDILHRLLPDVKICVAHGQMDAKSMENILLEFIRGDYDMMLSTTIIENGLDIPNANTIIINQAQNYGLSDLHQLRGRVGRSNKKAFCYLIVPPLISITEDARRRLKAIEEFSDLGGGFNIAMQDLDIRGAGNLLGAEQSGYIMDMGYETYQKILSEAMEELGVETGISTRSDSSSYTDNCTIETDHMALIPDDYIDITAEKIRIYRQLDSIASEKELDRLASQLKDRFGEFHTELSNLFLVVKIRNMGAKLGFEKIIIKNGMFICFFISNQMSPYFKSKTFEGVLARLQDSNIGFVFKQSEGRLKLVAKGVDSLEKAYLMLKKLQQN